MTASTATDLIFVLHEIVDADEWGKFFGGVLDMCKSGTTIGECWALPVWGGNTCHLTLGDEAGRCSACIWNVPAGMTVETFQTFIDGFTGPCAKNTPSKIASSMGFSNLNDVTYMKDMIEFAESGAVHPFAGSGDIFFVYHKVLDKETWNSLFGQLMASATECTCTADLEVAWKIRSGFHPLGTASFVTGDALCFWEAPKGTTPDQFQDFIDGFTDGAKNENIFRVQMASAANSRLLHKDMYTVDTIKLAKVMMGK